MVKETSYYEIMEIDPLCTDLDLKKQYKKLAIQYHPDKDPNNLQKFKAITQVYRLLSCYANRCIYDKGGEQAVKNMVLCFSEKRHEPPKIDDLIFELVVTNDELKKGTVRRIVVDTNVCCNVCFPHEDETTLMHDCGRCNSRGIEINTTRILNILLSRERKQPINSCPNCNGMGKYPTRHNICPSCNGVRTFCMSKLHYIELNKDMHFGHKIVMKSRGNEKPLHKSGDLVVVLVEKKSVTF